MVTPSVDGNSYPIHRYSGGYIPDMRCQAATVGLVPIVTNQPNHVPYSSTSCSHSWVLFQSEYGLFFKSADRCSRVPTLHPGWV